MSVGGPYRTSFSLTDLRMSWKSISGNANTAATSASKISTIAPRVVESYDLPSHAIWENDLRKSMRLAAFSKAGCRASSMKWCKQIKGVQLALRRDV